MEIELIVLIYFDAFPHNFLSMRVYFISALLLLFLLRDGLAKTVVVSGTTIDAINMGLQVRVIPCVDSKLSCRVV